MMGEYEYESPQSTAGRVWVYKLYCSAFEIERSSIIATSSFVLRWLTKTVLFQCRRNRAHIYTYKHTLKPHHFNADEKIL